MAFRSSSFTTWGANSATKVVAPPVGVQVDDIVVVTLNEDNDVTATRGGWTAKASPEYVSSGLKGGSNCLWKRMEAADLSGSWTFTLSGSSPSLIMATAWSGRIKTGDPFDFYLTNSTVATNSGPTPLSGTATGSDIGYLIHDYGGMTLAATGYSGGQVTQYAHAFHLDSQTGSIAPVVTGYTSAGNAYWSYLFGLKSDTGGTPNDAEFDLAIAEREKVSLSTLKSASTDLNSAAIIKVELGAAKSATVDLALEEELASSIEASKSASAMLAVSEHLNLSIGASGSNSAALVVAESESVVLGSTKSAGAHLAYGSEAEITVDPVKSVGVDLSSASDLRFTLSVGSELPNSAMFDLIAAEDFALDLDGSKTGTTGLLIAEDLSLELSVGAPASGPSFIYPESSATVVPQVNMINPETSNLVYPE